MHRVKLDRFGIVVIVAVVEVVSVSVVVEVVDVKLDRFGRTSARRVRNRGSRRSLSQGFK